MALNTSVLVVLAALATGCAAKRVTHTPDPTRVELVRSVKDFEKQAGFEETGNFSRPSDRWHVDYRCYYTGKLKLPADYYKLKLRRGGPNGCALNENKYDVFFYPVEAVASGHTPLTPSLEKATVERTLVVVPHEDFHNDRRIEDWPTAISEAASTLVGFLTAAEFAKSQYGASSAEYKNLRDEAKLFLRKAELVNTHAERLAEVYRSRRAGEITKVEALQQKQQIFNQLVEECAALPVTHSFNKCPGALNNAGLAFDRTYTEYYPLLWKVYRERGASLNEMVSLLRPPERRRMPLSEAVDYFEKMAASP